MCNRIVRVLLRADRAGRLSYAPLQSAPAQAYLQAQRLPTEDFDSLVFVMDWDHPSVYPPLFRTDGALAALREVGGGWRVLAWLRFVPAVLRDPLYRLVARTRYKLFGVYRPSPLPVPEWEKRFLSN